MRDAAKEDIRGRAQGTGAGAEIRGEIGAGAGRGPLSPRTVLLRYREVGREAIDAHGASLGTSAKSRRPLAWTEVATGIGTTETAVVVRSTGV